MGIEGTSLFEISDAGATLTLGEHTYVLRKPQLADFAQVQAHIRDRRLQAYMNATRVVPLDPDVKARAMGEITCKPISMVDMWEDFESKAELLWLAIRENDPKKLTLTWVTKQMPSIDRDMLAELMFYLCGIRVPGEAAPLTDTTPTDLSCAAPSDGTKS